MIATVQPAQIALALRDVSKIFASRPLLRLPWAEVFGLDVVRQELRVKQLINRVSVDPAFFKKLSPMENLIYAGRLPGGLLIFRAAERYARRTGCLKRSG